MNIEEKQKFIQKLSQDYLTSIHDFVEDSEDFGNDYVTLVMSGVTGMLINTTAAMIEDEAMELADVPNFVDKIKSEVLNALVELEKEGKL